MFYSIFPPWYTQQKPLEQSGRHCHTLFMVLGDKVFTSGRHSLAKSNATPDFKKKLKS
jgi:hypothetical protein